MCFLSFFFLTFADKVGPLCLSVTKIFSKNTKECTDAVSAKKPLCVDQRCRSLRFPDTARCGARSFRVLFISSSISDGLGRPRAPFSTRAVCFSDPISTLSAWNRLLFSLHLFACLVKNKCIFRIQVVPQSSGQNWLLLLSPLQLCYYPFIEIHLRQVQESVLNALLDPLICSCVCLQVVKLYGMFCLYLLLLPCVVRQPGGDIIILAFFII